MQAGAATATACRCCVKGMVLHSKLWIACSAPSRFNMQEGIQLENKTPTANNVLHPVRCSSYYFITLGHSNVSPIMPFGRPWTPPAQAHGPTLWM